MKKIVSIALALLLIVTMIPMAVFADSSKATDIVDVNGKSTITLGGVEYKVITTAAEVTDPAGNYYLANDLTLTAPLLEGSGFTGKFNGGGKVITLNGSNTVFATTVGGAGCLVANFTIKGNDVTLSQYDGVLSPDCTHGGTFYNITNEVNVISDDSQGYMYIGGLVGAVSNAATADVTFEKCVNKGNIKSTKAVAGGIMAGIESNANEITIKFIDCANFGTVSGGHYAGGIMGANSNGKVKLISFEGCSNNAKVSGAAATGGILAGSANGTAASANYKIVNCTNDGEIAGTDVAAGGIMGGSYKTGGANTIVIENCVNTAKVATTGNFGAGGMIGYFNAPVGNAEMTIKNCANYGDVSSKNGFVGGIFGAGYKSGNNVLNVTIENCVNTGDVSVTDGAQHYLAGGIVGGTTNSHKAVFTVKSCVNFGDVDGKGQKYTGGIIGGSFNGGEAEGLAGPQIVVTNCYNAGVVKNENADGCFVSEIANIEIKETFNGKLTVSNSYSTGTGTLCYVSEFAAKDIADTVGTTTLAKVVEAANKVLDNDGTYYVKDGAVLVCEKHEYKDGACKTCGAKDPNYVAPDPKPEDPKPAPTSDITVYALAIALVSLAGVVVAKKKIRE